ncbi:MAG TPA: glycosyltransferase family 4 protein [Agitococcus sp.]|nr:glycosyltransferase family 4 protein [Agitococcus sp.]
MNQAVIAIILPPRERFRPADAGAVALTVKDFVLASQYASRSKLVVIGRETYPFANVPYQYVSQSFLGRVLGTTKGYAYDCCQWLKQHRSIAIVEVHNRIPLALFIKKKYPHLKVCLHLHNDPYGMQGAKTQTQRHDLLVSLDRIYCVSHYVRRQLLVNLEEYTAKTQVIYNALALPQKLINLERKQNYIVYVGRFIPEKGVLELAQALALVLPQFPQWKAVFLGAWGFGHAAGKSVYEQSVYTALADIGAQVEFKGHVSQAEVMQTLAISSVVVVPSTCGEAFGRVALEAMSMTNAVVVSHLGALPEIVGDAGVILAKLTPDYLAQQLINLLLHPDKIRSLATAAQQQSQFKFSLATQVAQLDDSRQQFME